MQEQNKAISIVVTGDVTIDWNIAHEPHKLREPTDWTGEMSCSMSWQYGSASLLADLIKTMTNQLKSKLSAPPEVMSPDTPAPKKETVGPFNSHFVHSYAVWAPYHDKKPGGGKPGKPCWRVERFVGLDRPSKKAAKLSTCKIAPRDPANADIIVIDDSNLGFRDQPSHWPQAIRTPSRNGKAPWIIVKMSKPVAKGKLWEHLVSGFSSRLIVILTIDDLRQSEIQVSSRISWERTAQELLWELTHNPKVNGLNNSAYTIVSFGPTGALLLQEHNKPAEAPKLLFDPLNMEGEGSAEKGMMIGKTSILVARIVREIILNPETPDFVKGIQCGVTAMRHLNKIGYDTGTDKVPRLHFPTEKVMADLKNEAPLAVARLPIFNGENKGRPSSWTILKDRYYNDLEQLSQRIVLEGATTALKEVPVARFGQLVTVDRQEIEALRSIHSLISEYCNRDEERPLSIAVFGPPGSGKSFAVKEIAKVANPDKIAGKTLTFNLSQFNKSSELIDAFHQIRDVALSGKIPLVFWDEFDSTVDSKELGWLRYFLAPMQDGEFQQGQLTHPVGKAIFVFAGGTRSSIDSFLKNAKEKEKTTLADAKVPDFLSRLKGFLNVLGPNPQKADENDDPYFIVRRALLLRSLFKWVTPHLFDENKLNLDKGILRAFLHVDTYRHGARSMESIVAMSRLGNATQFNRSCLPPEEQLSLHVDPKAFIALVHHLELEGKLLEKLAQLNHELFCERLKAQGYVWGEVTDEEAHPRMHSSLVAYHNLSEHEQEQNRSAVRDIPNKLAAFGYVMVPRRNNEPDLELPSNELEAMAKREHERWMETKINDKWEYSTETEKGNNLHALLVDWNELPETEKEKDRSIISRISCLLGEAGYTIGKLAH